MMSVTSSPSSSSSSRKVRVVLGLGGFLVVALDRDGAAIGGFLVGLLEGDEFRVLLDRRLDVFLFLDLRGGNRARARMLAVTSNCVPQCGQMIGSRFRS